MIEAVTAFAKGDLAALAQLFDPEAVWHAQRLGILGGDHRGWPQVLRFFAQSMELTQGTFGLEIREILANDSSAAAVVRSSARRGDRALDDQQVHLFHFVDGRVVEIWQFVGDGTAVEAFWT